MVMMERIYRELYKLRKMINYMINYLLNFFTCQKINIIIIMNLNLNLQVSYNVTFITALRTVEHSQAYYKNMLIINV